MYNGKNRSDFTPDQLPSNRFALFFDMLKTRFLKLIQVNLMFVLFLLPAIFFIYAFIMYIMLGAEVEDMLQMLNQTLLFLIPCLGFAGIGMTGLVYITRNWARDEHAWVWSDFIDTIKHNWKQGLVLGLIDGVLIYVISMAGLFYAMNSGANVLFYGLGWLMVVLLIVLGMVNIYIWPMIITYDLGLFKQLRNALVLALGRLPFSLLFLVITLLPVALTVIFMQYLMIPFIFYYGLIGFALHSFINVSYTNATFDKYINLHIEGAKVNQGLRVEEDDEYDDYAGDDAASDSKEG